eukprot:CAMPEP_0184988514 /NCGR_PEP_ID=MMETSP1098-20130426/24481_1 /TAXON_ID=89044 /ORGANISM="Spumella elongata, Strain CCAP 955/1" /LENGTH=303 /DNA_ID=CAMNT_0027513271 /DNA_START=313 /DNA_END=1224 /DNA_ORIENTATION=+
MARWGKKRPEYEEDGGYQRSVTRSQSGALGKRTATASTTDVQTPQVSALAAVEMDTAQIAGQTVTAISDSKTTSEKAKTAASKTGMEINEEQIQMRRAMTSLGESVTSSTARNDSILKVTEATPPCQQLCFYSKHQLDGWSPTPGVMRRADSPSRPVYSNMHKTVGSLPRPASPGTLKSDPVRILGRVKRAAFEEEVAVTRTLRTKPTQLKGAPAKKTANAAKAAATKVQTVVAAVATAVEMDTAQTTKAISDSKVSNIKPSSGKTKTAASKTTKAAPATATPATATPGPSKIPAGRKGKAAL